MDTKSLTAEVKNHAKELGADLVGIAGVDRWAKAPVDHGHQRAIYRSGPGHFHDHGKIVLVLSFLMESSV